MQRFLKSRWLPFLFSFEGRTSRSEFWFGYAGLFFVAEAFAALFDFAADADVLSPVVSLAGLWSGVALSAKRCHARGRSGWFLLLYLIPIVSLWPIVEVFFLKGTDGPNAYGADPAA